MKRLIAISLVLILVFTFAACGGGAAPSGGSDAQSARTVPAPSSSQDIAPTSSTAPSDTAAAANQNAESVPISIRICMNSDGEYVDGNSITHLILLYSGSNGSFDISDVTDLTMYVDGVATPVSCVIERGPTDWQGYEQYDLIMNEVFTQHPASYSFSCMYNGTLIEADETLNWSADKTFSYAPTREDMPSLEAPFNNGSSSTSDLPSTTPDTAPNTPDDSSTPDTSNAPDNSGGINGTLFDLPAPFEAHEGDKQYFCIGDDERFSDDYIVTMETRDEHYNLPGNPVTVYFAAFFDEEGNITSNGWFSKYVFETEAVAEEYCTIDTTFIPVGNVAYKEPMQEGVMRGVLENPYKEAQITHANNTGATIYLSKP